MAPAPSNRNRILSSLPLQGALYFNAWYAPLYFVLNIIVFVYKGLVLSYPTSYYGAEIAFIVIFGFEEAIRLYVGWKGNKNEQKLSAMFFLVMSFLAIAASIYFLYFQVYVLFFDIMVNAVLLAFVAVEVVFGLVVTIRFARHATY